MARVLRQQQALLIAADSEAERELLAHGQRHGGQLVLLEAYYTVEANRLLLPETISPQGAERVRAALEAAALSHRQAQERRSRFRVLKSVGR